MGAVRPFLLSWLLLLLWCGAALQARAQQGFAVQIASVQSGTEAETLVKGLRVRGLNAYWVRAEVPGKGIYYRIRVGGQFTSGKSAAEYGRKLVQAGLVGEYAVFKYDAPVAGAAEVNGTPAERALNRTKSKPVTPAKTPVATGAIAQGQPRQIDNRPLGPSTASASVPAPPPPLQKTTNYLITGAPVAGHELEARKTVDRSAGIQTAERANSSSAGRDTRALALPRNPAHSKHSDEIELDDFQEFAPQALRGTVQAKDGALFVLLQNRNSRFRFRGTVKLALIQGNRENQQAPMQIEIAPGQEHFFEVPGVGRDGSYLMSVYDEQGALQLMQQGGLGPTAPSKQVVAENQPPPHIAPAPTSHPGDVPVQPPLEVTEPDEEPPIKEKMRTANYPTGKVEDENAPANPEQNSATGQANTEPGDVKVIVRQIAASTENLTIEFEILAQQPLGMISLAMRSASVGENKQAIMTTKQGRVPFLIPAGDANGNISYELKDEHGRLLAAGSKSLPEISK